MDQDHRIALVEKSFEQINKHESDFVSEFYAKLFDTYPQIKPFFFNIDTSAQGAKLYASLALLVQNLRQPDALKQVLHPLGKKHIGYGATPERYLMVEQVLIDSLKTLLGDDWTPQLHQAWADTMERVIDIMLEGAGTSPPNRDPKTKPGETPT